MSEEEPKTRIFTLPIPYFCDLFEETDEQIIVVRGLLEDFLNKGEKENHKLTPLVIKLLWVNYAILEILQENIDDPVYHVNGETGEDEYLIPEEIIFKLQNLVVTKYFAAAELNRLSCSVLLH